MLLGIGLVLACVGMLVSVLRLESIVAPTYLHPEEMKGVFRDGGQYVDALAAQLPSSEYADLDRELFSLTARASDARVAVSNEILLELDARLSHWATAPQTFARLGSLGGFLFASMVVRTAMNAPPIGSENLVASFQDAMIRAVTPVLIGFALTAFCIAVRAESRSRLRTKRAQFDDLVDTIVDIK